MDFFKPPYEDKKLNGFDDLDKTLENEPFSFDLDKDELEKLDNGTGTQSRNGGI